MALATVGLDGLFLLDRESESVKFWSEFVHQGELALDPLAADISREPAFHLKWKGRAEARPAFAALNK